ncbi:MAG: 2-oxopent-4-enoate hydratase, partial [Azovibrio sp.]
MEQAQITQLGDELYAALCSGKTVSPLTSRGFDISIEDAYHIQQRMLARRLEKGEKVIGKKIGVTSAAVMNLLG